MKSMAWDRFLTRTRSDVYNVCISQNTRFNQFSRRIEAPFDMKKDFQVEVLQLTGFTFFDQAFSEGIQEKFQAVDTVPKLCSNVCITDKNPLMIVFGVYRRW